ncbi:MAG: hypothetical protein GX428_09665, partial [Candidatus Atribacteria bacterium]|nr:hypothetical protein [Candidatus Atribacteria bacterium]
MSEIDKTKYPGNSHTSKELVIGDDIPSRNVTKVANATLKKKSFLSKVGGVFFGSDTDNVGSYILYDILIPAAKNTLSEMVSSGIEMLLFGENRRTSVRRDRDKSYISYNSISRDRSAAYRVRANHHFDEIIIDSRAEAEEVLSSLVELIDTYGVATVSDFYDLIGMTADFTDNKYGWKNLNRSSVNRV